jgi:hypothetical protein
MKIIIGSISTLLIFIFLMAITQSVHAAIVTGTPTAGTATQIQTEMSGNPSQTYTPPASVLVTPTTTLLPLPAITLIFPASTSTSTVTETPKPIIVSQTPNPTQGVEFAKLSPRIRILAILLVLLWLVLAGFVVIYIRQFK